MNSLFRTLSALVLATYAFPLRAMVLPPSITTQPQSLTVVTGQTASFTVVATGTPPLTYQWRFNGASIAGTAGPSFVKANVRPTDAGNYSVVVANTARSVTSQVAVLTVVVAPSITAQPAARDAVAGSSATFTVVASGGGLTYQWRFASPNSTNTINIPGATNATHTLVNVQPANAGTYRVVVTNLAGSVLSATAPLTVLTITSQPQSQSVAVGSNAIFSVTATGKTPISYRWHFNDSILPGATNATLELPRTQPLHSGVYHAVVANVAGAITSSPARLTVALVPAGAAWKYLDDGSDQGTAWREFSFDDSAWPVGFAKFGYGDSNEVTTLQRLRTNGTPIVTAYFRREFHINRAMLYSNLTARFLRDDGVVVYLNGREIFRDNMPQGEPTYASSASAGVGGSDETTYFETNLPPSILRDGVNRLAVELHQVPATSDAGFDLELFGQAAPLPEITTQPVTRAVSLGTAAVTFNVGASAGGPFRYQWLKNGQGLPRATNSSLTLFNVLEPEGGAYQAVLLGPHGATLSQPAELLFLVSSNPAASDSFAAAGALTGGTNRVRGSNVGAGKEPGEPEHGRKPGGRSVWYRWTPPSSGIATFRTKGSSFDTLLGVYTGTNVAILEPVASDEDSGGFHTSEVSFNALAGTTYRIAVDGLGFGGTAGNFLLSWTHEVTNARIPVLTNAPASQTVKGGAQVTLSVGASSPGATYQWLFNNMPIPGATLSRLTLGDVQAGHVGCYQAQVTSPSGRSIRSAPAVIELGSSPDGASFDKREDYFTRNAGSSRSNSLPFQAADGASTTNMGTITLGLGEPTYHISPTGTGSVGDPLPFSEFLGGSTYLWITNSDAGFIAIDSFGSVDNEGGQLLTTMSVYRHRPPPYTRVEDLYELVARDDTSAAQGRASRVCFPALEFNQVYEVVMATDTAGVIVLTNFVAPMHYFYKNPAASEPLVLRISEKPGNPTYRWLRNEVLLSETSRSLNLSPLQCNDSAVYKVRVSRPGATPETNVVAHVHVNEWTAPENGKPFHLYYHVFDPGTNAHMLVLAWASASRFEMRAVGMLQTPAAPHEVLETTAQVTDARIPLCHYESTRAYQSQRYFYGYLEKPNAYVVPCP